MLELVSRYKSLQSVEMMKKDIEMTLASRNTFLEWHGSFKYAEIALVY